MMKPRITYDIGTGMYYCETLRREDYTNEEWIDWFFSPIGVGSSVKEAFLDWYNQMVGKHLDG